MLMGEFYEPETSRFFVHNFFLHEHPEMMELFGPEVYEPLNDLAI